MPIGHVCGDADGVGEMGVLEADAVHEVEAVRDEENEADCDGEGVTDLVVSVITIQQG